MRSGRPFGAVYTLELHNGGGVLLDGFMIQFNKNSFGLAPADQNVPVQPIAPRTTGRASVQITQDPSMLSPTAATPVLQASSLSLPLLVEKEDCVRSGLPLTRHCWGVAC